MDGVYLSPLTMALARRELEASRLSEPHRSEILKGEIPTTFGGVNILSSPALPMSIECKVCAGTGEGSSSTYCEECRGEGSTLVVGISAISGRMTRIVERQEKAFEPGWPLDVAVPLREITRR